MFILRQGSNTVLRCFRPCWTCAFQDNLGPGWCVYATKVPTRSLVSAAFFAQQLVSARWQRRKGDLMTCASQYSVKAGWIELSSNYIYQHIISAFSTHYQHIQSLAALAVWMQTRHCGSFVKQCVPTTWGVQSKTRRVSDLNVVLAVAGCGKESTYAADHGSYLHLNDLVQLAVWISRMWHVRIHTDNIYIHNKDNRNKHNYSNMYIYIHNVSIHSTHIFIYIYTIYIRLYTYKQSIYLNAYLHIKTVYIYIHTRKHLYTV